MKKLAYFAAISVAVIAQAASAQVLTRAPTPANLAATQTAPVAVKKNGTISVVIPATPTKAASVIMSNGMLWSFNGSGSIASAGASVAGVAVAPAALKAGMNCILTGTSGTPTGNMLTSLAC